MIKQQFLIILGHPLFRHHLFLHSREHTLSSTLHIETCSIPLWINFKNRQIENELNEKSNLRNSSRIDCLNIFVQVELLERYQTVCEVLCL